ncbi:MAG: Gfo/Idh/MocA family oxidoreductase [Candidatus Sumerlaeota bacterium]|nr:Gfo/Idh/MocA family oxidoreductase [Candidatus Sumerlaeota bacterium]
MVRFGVLGCGTMGSRHAECVVDGQGMRLVAVCDADRARAESVAAQFKAEAMTDARALFQRKDVDAVVVALPSALHAEFGVQAAQAGKHVMVEKPIDLSLEQARRLVETCGQRGVALSVVSQHRFHPDVLKLKQAADEGRLGRIVLGSAQSHWNRDQDYYEKAPGRGLTDPAEGGVLINQAVHYVDLLLWLCGPVAKARGFHGTLTHRIAVEDVSAVALEFENGALGTVTATTSIWPQPPERVEIFGSRGSVRIEGGEITGGELEGGWPDAPPADKDDFKPKLRPVRKQLEDFAVAIREGRKPLVTGEEGLAVLSAILEAYRSADGDGKRAAQ